MRPASAPSRKNPNTRRALRLEPLEDRRMLAIGAEFDFGDAPAPYPTMLADNGARHEAIGPTLGATRDAEPDGQPTTLADGDGPDEDGVTFGPIRVGQLDATLTVNIQNAPAGAKLDAWIDLNGDGSWGGPGEQIADTVDVSDGDNILTFDVTSWATRGNTYARFRLSTAGDLGVGGSSADGEVEDYRVTIESPAATLGVFSSQNIIADTRLMGESVFAADIDGDGDTDVIGAARYGDVMWYENDGNAGFTAHVVGTIAEGLGSVFAADVDGDGDVDVLSASITDGRIAWYENDGAGRFAAHTIGGANQAISIFAADVDGDGDIDVLSASHWDDTIKWYENDGSENFTSHRITTSANGARSVFAADVDGDGDMDVLSASILDNKIAWYENDGSQRFTAHTISNNVTRTLSVFAIDVDGDGDMDVLSATGDDGRILWFENDGSAGFSTHTIGNAGFRVYKVFAVDMDGDGDIDVLSGTRFSIAWYENDGEESFHKRAINTGSSELRSVFAADVDGDGDLDVLAAGRLTIVWNEMLNSADFGDAPSPYPTLIGVDGAVHAATGPTLGTARDDESDGQPTTAADGDGIDEDGVTFFPLSVAQLDATVIVNVQNATRSTLNVWIDFNGDGVWAGSEEHVARNVRVVAGDNQILFNVPLQAAVGTTYARFRLSTEDDLTPTGPAIDGEVEDYLITILPLGDADFGDAPAPFPSQLSDNGAVHHAGGPTLGAARDLEDDGQPTTAADGDGSDEDGITFSPLSVAQLDAAVMVNVQNAPAGAKLNAWIDFDGDGVWAGSEEHVARDVSVVNGDNEILFDIPLLAATGSTYARFRLSTDGNLNPTGAASDGEVEDYLVTILPLSDADFGDAPAPYPTKRFNSGAIHNGGGPMLGGSRDSENDGQPTAAADGDGDDEDGVTFGAIRVGQLGANVTVHVENAPNGARLDAWVDFNGDGNWGGSDEHIAAGVRVSNGDNKVRFDVPSGAVSGEVYARFRISTAGDLGIGGVAADGEVEDYRFRIDPPAPAAGSFLAREIGPGSANASVLNAADIDGDGAMDVLSTLPDPRIIVWYRNLGGGNFSQHTITESERDVSSIIVADIDGDGDLDVVTASYVWSYDDPAMTWYENDGTGDFTEHVIDTQFGGGAWLSSADMDGDGDMDLLRATAGTTLGTGANDAISWFENDGSENFTEHLIGQQANGTSVAVADVDGDGDMDVLSTSRGDGEFVDPKVSWFENDGSQNFLQHTLDTSVERPTPVGAADWDGDGDIDVLSSFWYENIDGSFTKRDRSSFPVADLDGDGDFDRLGASAAADMDGDGDLDLIGALGRNGPLVWFENLSPPPPPADLTGDGFVDFEDLTLLLAAWNQDVSAGEGNLVDADGTPVDFEDLTVLLAAWTGPGAAGAPVGRRLAAARERLPGGGLSLQSDFELEAPRQAAAYGRRETLRFRSAGGIFRGIGRLQAGAVDRVLEADGDEGVLRSLALARRARR